MNQSLFTDYCLLATGGALGYDAYINIKGFLNKLKKGDHLILLISEALSSS